MSTPIKHTQQWINKVVIGCNFCPFAAHVVHQQAVHYATSDATEPATALADLMLAIEQLNQHDTIATSFVVYTHGFTSFEDYLDLAELAEALLDQEGYEGVYQVASFHPQYCFDGADEQDAANYTNRSPYPMLHLLREEQVEAALEHHPDPEGIPDRNIEWAQKKGLQYMQSLFQQSFE